MASKENEKSSYDDFLNDAKRLAGDAEIPDDGGFSLEEILAEYGESRQQKLWADVEKQAEPGVPAELRRAAVPEPVKKTPPVSGEPAEKPAAQTPAEKSQPAFTAAAEKTAAAPLPEEAETTGGEEKESEIETTPDADTAVDPASQEEALRLVRRSLRKEEPPVPKPAPEEKPMSPTISMKDVVGQTVDAVMEEQHEELLPEKKRRWGLFSRKELEDTEQLFTEPEEPKHVEEDLVPETIGPEEPLDEMADSCGDEASHRRSPLTAAFLVWILLALPMAAEYRGFSVPVWHESTALRTGVMLAFLVVQMILCRGVIACGFSRLRHRRFSGELMISLSAFAAAADCATRLVLTGRTAAEPYALAAAAGLAFAQWGLARGSRGRYDMYRTAAMSDPPYLVTNTSDGACKQAGRITGFYTDTVKPNLPEVWQATMLPLILAATVVFAVLSSVGQGRRQDFLLCWSAILAASAMFSMPLNWSLPWSALSRRLQKCGCTVADWAGTEAISRSKTMILTDTDLFPPGTVLINGIKVFGEELPRAVSYAASLVRASGSGLQRLFDGLIRSEGGHLMELDDFSFYEEGGFAGTVHGESVLLGTESFMRKMEVRLPSNLKLNTGLYLAVDRQLTAVFAVKYNASENVDWALRMLRHNHITPILAARDPNVTPALLKRKFNRKVKVSFPKLSDRLALSEAERDSGMPHALLLREGLLPYAETVVGCQRLVKAARHGTAISLLGSAAGALLAFYLTFLGNFTLMQPVTMLIFLLLWVLPSLLYSGWAGRV
jgi:hypothetical protein